MSEDPEVKAASTVETPETTGNPSNEGKIRRAPASRAVSWLLVGFAVWSWVIWPVFIKNIAADPRSFTNGSPTAFFDVHLVLTVVSLAFAVVFLVIGIRGLLAARRAGRS